MLFLCLHLVGLKGYTQQLNVDSLASEFDRICDCNSLKDSSQRSYAKCIENEAENPFFHRDYYFYLSNYWADLDQSKSLESALKYFEMGGYFRNGIDSILLTNYLQLSSMDSSYFTRLFKLARINEEKVDSARKSNSRISQAIINLKSYDQFFRSDKEENLKALNGNNLEKGNWKFQIQLDSLNRTFLSAILDSTWITIENYGNEANKVAWLIAQHADLDIEFQESCLKLMLAAYPKDRNSSGIHLAYLIDRISINRHGYQYFGTQFTFKNGEIEPKPIKNPELVELRRKLVYLPKLKKYLEDSSRYLERD